MHCIVAWARLTVLADILFWIVLCSFLLFLFYSSVLTMFTQGKILLMFLRRISKSVGLALQPCISKVLNFYILLTMASWGHIKSLLFYKWKPEAKREWLALCTLRGWIGIRVQVHWITYHIHNVITLMIFKTNSMLRKDIISKSITKLKNFKHYNFKYKNWSDAMKCFFF